MRSHTRLVSAITNLEMIIGRIGFDIHIAKYLTLREEMKKLREDMKKLREENEILNLPPDAPGYHRAREAFEMGVSSGTAVAIKK